MKKSGRSFVRTYNRHAILDIIRISELISRIDIARSTGLSQASVTAITADLIDEGLILEKRPGVHEGGRPPILLSISPEGAHAIGINLTLEKIDIAIINFQAEIKAFHSKKLNMKNYSVHEIINIIVDCVKECMWEADFSKQNISGIGIGIPGLVDSQSGRICFLPNYGWENVNFRDLFQKQINIPTYIENSSNNLAIAEHWFGTGKGMDNFIVVTLENGIGAGYIINGEISRGHGGIAGEFGHLSMDPNGPTCRCGKKGCLEAFAGNNSIMRDAKNIIKQGLWDIKSEGTTSDDITFDDVINALNKQEPELIKIFEKAGTVLGTGISHLITLLNPEKIIITGKGVKAKDKLFDSMFLSINRCVSRKLKIHETEIIIKKWCDKEWVKGAGALVLKEIYKSPEIIKTALTKTIKKEF